MCKCIVQDPSIDQISITKHSGVSISGQALISSTDTANDGISLDRNVHPTQETSFCRQSKPLSTVRSEFNSTSKTHSVFSR